jgi:hypothetical protein
LVAAGVTDGTAVPKAVGDACVTVAVAEGAPDALRTVVPLGEREGVSVGARDAVTFPLREGRLVLEAESEPEKESPGEAEGEGEGEGDALVLVDPL